MKRTITSIFAIMLALAMVLSLAACGEDNFVVIPDISDTDETTAKTLLSSNSLIPSVKEEYDDNVEAGKVIKSEPEIGTKVEKNSKVTIYISKGSSHVESKDARIEWFNISQEKDDWNFSNPYIDEETLYIYCSSVTFAADMKWKDDYNDGLIIGDASINDTFNKTVPVQAKYEKQAWKANEKQSFTLEIPLKDLEVTRPTDMYLRLYTINPTDESKQSNDVKVNFYFTW